jgi:phospholipid/cholesterol/gamma-HCH transport system ATP-binding protein
VKREKPDKGESRSKPFAAVVENTSLGYGEHVVLKDVSLKIQRGEIVSILGGSGCGKSTLMRAMIGLLPPLSGTLYLDGEKITGEDSEEALQRARRRIGVLFQSSALLGSLTLAENVALPLEEHTELPRSFIRDIVHYKLRLFHLEEYGHYLPSELSGGMRKRAGLARAMAMDPEILFCDEPSAGLDPITAAQLDRVLLDLNELLHTTVVVITHELASIETISKRCFMLEKDAQGIIAEGTPAELKERTDDPRVWAFFHRKPDTAG